MATRGRPVLKGTRVVSSFKLDNPLADEVDDIIDAYGVPRARLMRELVRAGMPALRAKYKLVDAEEGASRG